MLTFHSLGHQVADQIIFHDLSLSLESKRYGLVGPNGIGKTSLAMILAGKVEPSLGSVHSSSMVTYFAQKERPDPKSTVAEFLMSIWDGQSELLPLILRLTESLDLDRNLAQLSGGEWIKARLAKTLSENPGFLILDEPTNNLDESGRSAVMDLVRTFSGGLLVISHDRELLNEMDVIIEFSNQGLSVFGGNFDFYAKERDQERLRQTDEVKELSRLSRKAERDQSRKLQSQEKRMRYGEKNIFKRALPKILAGARKRNAQNSMGKLINQENEAVAEIKSQAREAFETMKKDPFIRLDFEGAAAPAGKTLVAVDRLNIRYRSGEFLWKESVSFTLNGSQRLQISGRNGSGKSTLIRTLISKANLSEVEISGSFRINANGIAYLDQKYGELNPKLSVLDNIKGYSRFDEIELRNELAFYGFTGDQVKQKVETLSGGETLKACLAQMFLGNKVPELIILDEPTNNLDLQSMEILERSLEKFAGAIIVVSHDGTFIENLKVDQTLTLDIDPKFE